MEGGLMKEIGRTGRVKLMVAFVAAALCLSLYPAAAFASSLETTSIGDSPSGQELQTNSVKNMKSRGVLFDLKPGKPMTYYIYGKVVGKIKYTATVSKPKITSKKAGYKTATFTITHRLKNNLTKKQQRAIFKAYRKYKVASNIFGNSWNHFLDFNTGMSAEVAGNDNDVTWKKLSNKLTHTKTYRAADGAWFYAPKKWTAKYSITYPADYKGLCIGIGGDTMPYNSRSAADRKYDSLESISYFKTSHFKKGLKNNHFMRVS